MKQQGILAVVSGFSGAGKGTIMKALMNKYDNYALSISATTRNPREGEVHGREYFFLTTEQFEDMIEKDQFIEYAQYVKNYYGTPRSYVEENTSEMIEDELKADDYRYTLPIPVDIEIDYNNIPQNPGWTTYD